MQFRDGHTTPNPPYQGDTHEDHQRGWGFRTALAETQNRVDVVRSGIDPEVRDALLAKVKPQTIPDAPNLVWDMLDIIEWLRGRMTARTELLAAPVVEASAERLGSLDEGVRVRVRQGSAKSRPPLDVSALEASDWLVEVLAFWADELCGGVYRSGQRFYRRDGLIRGHFGACGVERLVCELAGQVGNSVPDGFVDDVRWGLWVNRLRVFNMFPGLSLLFDVVEPRVVDVVEPEGLW